MQELVQESAKMVLVVDDNAVMRKLLSALMRKFGFVVTAARDGAEAVGAARHKRFDCILMDIDMPHMTGLEAARAIRSLPGEWGRVPIIAVTARNHPSEVAECHAAGIDAHLGKPVAFHDLHRTIQAALRHRHLPVH